MPQQRQYGFSLLTSTALLGITGAATVLGAMPELTTLPDLVGAAPLALLGAAVWLRRRREHRIAARLRNLRLTVTLPMPPAGMRGDTLVFQPAGHRAWCAPCGAWQIEMERDGGPDLPWHLSLARRDGTMDPLPLAHAASLDAMLTLARRLLPGMVPPPLAGLLDGDLSFPLLGLPDGAGRGIMALAEGGYALQAAEGCRAIAPELAEILLCRGNTVPATPF
ncbi:MAG: hypothetical protein JWP20_1027 [Roseomonas sp.]|jgi:hypothetical protein|nr:hypothetical protein [Roseomonas sp.]